MNRFFSLWAIGRLAERKMCKVERTMSCLPLKGDPICTACYEEEVAAPLDRLGARNDGHCEERSDEAISGVVR